MSIDWGAYLKFPTLRRLLSPKSLLEYIKFGYDDALVNYRLGAELVVRNWLLRGKYSHHLRNALDSLGVSESDINLIDDWCFKQKNNRSFKLPNDREAKNCVSLWSDVETQLACWEQCDGFILLVPHIHRGDPDLAEDGVALPFRLDLVNAETQEPLRAADDKPINLQDLYESVCIAQNLAKKAGWLQPEEFVTITLMTVGHSSDCQLETSIKGQSGSLAILVAIAQHASGSSMVSPFQWGASGALHVDGAFNSIAASTSLLSKEALLLQMGVRNRLLPAGPAYGDGDTIAISQRRAVQTIAEHVGKMSPQRAWRTPGLPRGRRIPDDSPEPLTTRRPVAQKLRNDIKNEWHHPRQLLVIQGTPGWGKTCFIRLLLSGSELPVHFVDLADCRTGPDVACAVMRTILVSPDERERIDSFFVNAVDVLTDRLGAAIVVFENVHLAEGGSPPPQLATFTRALHDKGHYVVFEVWSQIQPIIESVCPHNVRYVFPQDLPALDSAEIREWACNVLLRAPSDDEITALDLFSGHPLGIGRALKLLASPVAGANPETLLDVAEDWGTLNDMFENIVSNAGTRTKGNNRLDGVLIPEFIAWFSVFPWATPALDDLPDPKPRLIRRLSAIGIVSVESSQIRVEAWGRMLGLRQVLENPELVANQEEWLQVVAHHVPEEKRQLQRRHLASLTVTISSQKRTLVTLLNLLPVPPLPESELEVATAPFEAPAPPEVFKPGLRGEISFPDDILSWLSESAARQEGIEELRAWLERMNGAPYRDACMRFWEDWQALKSLHQALSLLSAPQAGKWPLYQLALRLLRDAQRESAAPEDDGRQAWFARFLTAASVSAIEAGVPNEALDCLSSAEHIHAKLGRPEPSDYYACYLHDDTAYRIAEARLHFADSLDKLMDLHRVALDLVPQPSERPLSWGATWTFRELRHLDELLLCVPPDPAIVERLSSVLLELPIDDRWIKKVSRTLRRLKEYPECHSLLKQAVEEKVDSISESSVWGKCVKRAIRLRTMREIEPGTKLNWAEEAFRKLLEGGNDYVIVLVPALAGGSDSEFPETERAQSSNFSRKVLRELPTIKTFVDLDQLQELARTCLRNVSQHKIRTLGDVNDKAAQSLSTFIGIETRLDSLYAACIETCNVPGLWEDWAVAKIELSKRFHSIARHVKGYDFSSSPRNDVLNEFLEKCHSELKDCASYHAIALRISRYLWDWQTVGASLSRLIQARVDGYGRKHFSFLVVDALLGVAFCPKLLKPPASILDAVHIQLLKSALSDTLRTLDTPAQCDMASLLMQALGKEESVEFWQGVLEHGENIFVHPEGYWHHIARVAQTLSMDEEDFDVIDQLTDGVAMKMASTLFLFGAGVPSLSAEIRERLAAMAIVAIFDQASWFRSFHGSSPWNLHWNLGTAAGLGVYASKNGKFMGSSYAPQKTKRGDDVDWLTWIDGKMSAAHGTAFGAYRQHVRSCWDQLRTLTGGKELR